MKRLLHVLVGLGLVASTIVAPSAAARKAKPVATTLYLHGDMPVADMTEWVQGATGSPHRMMDTTEPAAGAPKSQSYFAVGNEECAGNDLYPSWEGKIEGQLASDVTIKAHMVSPGSTVTARVWLDVAFGVCAGSYTATAIFQPPAAEVTVDVPAGSNEVDIVLEGLKGKEVTYSMIVVLHQGRPGSQGRILYDSADYPSRVEFRCSPASGSSCAV